MTVKTPLRVLGPRTSWSGSRSVATTEKVTNDNGSSAVWQQASAIGSQKLWELVIPLSAAFTEAIYNEANTFQASAMTGGRSVCGAKVGRSLSTVIFTRSCQSDSWRLSLLLLSGEQRHTWHLLTVFIRSHVLFPRADRQAGCEISRGNRGEKKHLFRFEK